MVSVLLTVHNSVLGDSTGCLYTFFFYEGWEVIAIVRQPMPGRISS